MKNLSSNLRKISNLKHPGQIILLLALVGLTIWFDYRKQANTPVIERGVFTGVCIGVVDGDTLDVRTEDGNELRIRLLGIDAMETYNEEKMAAQAAEHERSVEHIRVIGERAKEALRDFALNAPVTWEIPERTPVRDPYNRVLAYVAVGEQDLGEYLLSQGLAEVRRDQHPRSGRYREIARPLIR